MPYVEDIRRVSLVRRRNPRTNTESSETVTKKSLHCTSRFHPLPDRIIYSDLLGIYSRAPASTEHALR
jgi:hypothetical protein